MLSLALLQYLLDAIIITRRAELVLELLLRCGTENALRTLLRREDLEGCTKDTLSAMVAGEEMQGHHAHCTTSTKGIVWSPSFHFAYYKLRQIGRV